MNEQLLNTLLTQLAGNGIVGLILVIVLWAFKGKDKELTDERAARIEDAKAHTDALIAIQREVMTAVTNLSKIVDTFQKLEEDRERHSHVPSVVIAETRTVRRKT